jgi:RNA polymerase sigma-70 factor (ECF subfamily)
MPGRKQKRFKELTYCHFESLYRMAFARLGCAEDSEDVVQETYLKAYRAFDRFKEDGNPKTWLACILINVIRDHVRRVNRAPHAVPLEEALESASDDNSSAEERLSANELGSQLITALQSIPESFASALLLRELKGLSYQEIAETLQIPIGTVMSRLSRARELLRKKLTDEEQLASQIGGSNADRHNLGSS